MKRTFLFLGILPLLFGPLLASAQSVIVKKGDTLSKIARDNGLSLQAVVTLNPDIENPNLIFPGQVIDIDAPDVLGGTTGNYTPVSSFQTRTTQYISAAATSVPLASIKDKGGTDLTFSDVSASSSVRVYFTIEPGSSREEIFYCTGRSGNSLTPCVRGLAFSGGSEAASSTLAFAHNAGSVVIISDAGQFFNQYLSLDGTQRVDGVKTFNVFPVTSSTTAVPTTAAQFANKYYVDNVGAGGFTASNVSSTLGLQAISSGVPNCPTAAACVGINVSSTGGVFVDSGGKVAFSGIVTTSTIQGGTATFNGIETHNASSTFAVTTTFRMPPIDAEGGRIGMPVGSLVPFAATTSPVGWLLANGSAISRATYSSLFLVIGTQYGNGDGSTTFNLPDLRARTVHGVSSTEPAYDLLGETAGSSTHVMTTAEIAAHTHQFTNSESASGGTSTQVPTAAGVGGGGAINTGSSGSSQAFDIKDPYITMNWIIKY